MLEYRVEFFWTNSKGTKKTVLTIVEATSKTAAIKAARSDIESDYGLRALTLKNIRPLNV